MKTSNKILIGLAAICFLVPLIFAFTIHSLYTSGNYKSERFNRYDGSRLVDLKPYKVLHLKGNISNVTLTQDTSWEMSFYKEDSNRVHYAFYGDTLLIDLGVKRDISEVTAKPGQAYFEMNLPVDIRFATGVTTVICDSTNINYMSYDKAGQNSPAFYLYDADILLNSSVTQDNNDQVIRATATQLDQLQIAAFGSSTVDLMPEIGINDLQVALNGTGTLDLEDGHVKHLRLSGGNSAKIKAPSYLLKDAYTRP